MIKETVRIYGNAPYNIGVIHGGPGAAGEVAPVAKKLSNRFGVLEPLQTAASVSGQIEELYSQIRHFGITPIILVGYSWGAWLIFILASEYPEIAQKLILVSSGAFEDKYNTNILSERLNRLCENERAEAERLLRIIQEGVNTDLKENFRRFGSLISKADSFEELNEEEPEIVYRPDIHQTVWKEAQQLRSSGMLLKFARNIKIPVTAIHGDYDPHPLSGVREPLSNTLKNFKMIVINKCGHTPWREKYAMDKFYKILEDEVKNEPKQI